MKLKRQETHMKAFGAGGFDDDKGGSSKLKEIEAALNAERLRNLELAKQKSTYMEAGEAMVREMRDNQMKLDHELKEQAQRELDGKGKNTSFLPSLYDS